MHDAGEERGAVGRPATVVELDGHRVCGVGAEINVHHVATLAVDLQGDVVSERRLSLDAAGESPERVIDRLAELLTRPWRTSGRRAASRWASWSASPD